jgi:hypothetical protein
MVYCLACSELQLLTTKALPLLCDKDYNAGGIWHYSSQDCINRVHCGAYRCGVMVHDVMHSGACTVMRSGAQHKWDKWCALWWLWYAKVVLWCAVAVVIFQLILPPFWCCFGGAGWHGYTFFRLRRLQIIR